MKFNKIKISFFVFGLAAFVYLISRFGVDQILSNIQRAGWSLLYIIAVWFAIYLLNALAWKLVLGSAGKGVSFPRLFMVTVSGFVINYITPVVALGGEPYKVKALSGTLGAQQSLSAVVLYRMVHLLGHMFLLLTGIVAALLSLAIPLVVQVALVIVGVMVFSVIILTFSGHRHGVFHRFHNFASRMRFMRRLADKMQNYEQHLEDMDRVVTGVYNHDRNKFYSAIFLEYLSRLMMAAEVYLILHGVGVETSMASALYLYVSYSIIINLLFFIPLNLGAREGGLALGLESLALPPLLGVYLGVVMRIREFFWILLGLLFILLTSDKEGIPTTKTI